MRRLVMLLMIALLVPAAAGARKPGNHYPDPVFLTPESLPVHALLPPAPRRGSATDRADFARILALQGSRTPAEVARAAAVVDVNLGTLFGPPYGPLTADEVRRWAPLFEKIRIDTDFFVQETKKLGKRPRPYVADRRVQPAVKREWTHAFPSGHAAISLVFARFLSDLDPSRRAAFEARARQIGDDRVLAGVHHPSDIEAGRALGERVAARLRESPRFRRELTERVAAFAR
jgi:acid phosphatase (class A)